MIIPDIPDDADFLEEMEPYMQIFTEHALKRARESYGPLSAREVEMMSRLVKAFVTTLIETHKIIEEQFSKNPAVVARWDKVLEESRRKHERGI